MKEFIFLVDAAVLTLLIAVYFELTSKRNAYVGTNASMSKYLNYFSRTMGDLQAIQASIDYLSRNGGGTTTLEAGTYSVDGTIEMKSKVWVHGEKS